MRFIDAIRGAGRPRNDQEAIQAIRAEHGDQASRFLANRLGIGIRQAQRYLAGQVRRPKEDKGRALRGAADPARIAASRLRSARTISMGKVPVGYDGKSRGTITPGVLTVDGVLRGELDQVAQALESGDYNEADRLFSQAIIGAKEATRGNNRDTARSHINITDYREIGLS